MMWSRSFAANDDNVRLDRVTQFLRKNHVNGGNEGCPQGRILEKSLQKNMKVG